MRKKDIRYKRQEEPMGRLIRFSAINSFKDKTEALVLSRLSFVPNKALPSKTLSKSNILISKLVSISWGTVRSGVQDHNYDN